jgi:hypothetical protein
MYLCTCLALEAIEYSPPVHFIHWRHRVHMNFDNHHGSLKNPQIGAPNKFSLGSNGEPFYEKISCVIFSHKGFPLEF